MRIQSTPMRAERMSRTEHVEFHPAPEARLSLLLMTICSVRDAASNSAGGTPPWHHHRNPERSPNWFACWIPIASRGVHANQRVFERGGEIRRPFTTRGDRNGGLSGLFNDAQNHAVRPGVVGVGQSSDGRDNRHPALDRDGRRLRRVFLLRRRQPGSGFISRLVFLTELLRPIARSRSNRVAKALLRQDRSTRLNR